MVWLSGESAFQDIEQKVKDFASAENQRGAQCTVLCLLSHGSKGKIYAKSDKKGNPSVDIDKLVEILRECPELYGKPKLVFVQACRGCKYGGLMCIESK